MNFKHPQQLNETPQSINVGYPNLPPPPALFSVKQFARRNPAFSESALWNIRFKSKSRHSSKGAIETNGASSAFVTIGRKVLVDERAFFDWIRQQNKASK